jgi:metal-dependent amidase/aminoacylase/carboxypeptidase family protein
MDESWRTEIHTSIRHKIEHICIAAGASAEVRIDRGYPCLINDPVITRQARKAAEEYLGIECVHTLDLRMASEDFAFYSQELPSTFYRLGTGYTHRENHPVHHPRFDINEDALRTGMGLMAYIAMTN